MSNNNLKHKTMKDLFSCPQEWTKELREVLNKWVDMDLDYDSIKDMLYDINRVGYTFGYGLDCVPYDLVKMGGVIGDAQKELFLRVVNNKAKDLLTKLTNKAEEYSILKFDTNKSDEDILKDAREFFKAILKEEL